jgi:hypothetical protein
MRRASTRRGRVIGPQLDLFARRRPTFDEAALLKRLREAVDDSAVVGRGMTRAAIKRLMTPLPRLTVPK